MTKECPNAQMTDGQRGLVIGDWPLISHSSLWFSHSAGVSPRAIFPFSAFRGLSQLTNSGWHAH
jgi:hypothetical protein